MHCKLLNQTIIALIVCSLLVTLCYFFVDRATAEYVAMNITPASIWIKWITYIPPLFLFSAPAIAFVTIITLCFYRDKPNKLPHILLLASINLMVANSIKDELKFVFGRYWPTTWINNNLSWLKNHAYGFHFFHQGSAYQSFPSGHTTLIFAAMVIIWSMYPKWRLPGLLLCIAVMLSLIALNYHFVSDVIAGAFLGIIISKYTLFLSAKFYKQDLALKQ